MGSGLHRFAHSLGGDMDWTIILLNFVYAALGVVLMYISYKVFDKLSPKIDFQDELKKGNIAVAIFIAALFIAIALIISGTLK
jgi:putative membrane protein